MIPHYFAGLPFGTSMESCMIVGLISHQRVGKVVDFGSVGQSSQ